MMRKDGSETSQCDYKLAQLEILRALEECALKHNSDMGEEGVNHSKRAPYVYAPMLAGKFAELARRGIPIGVIRDAIIAHVPDFIDFLATEEWLAVEKGNRSVREPRDVASTVRSRLVDMFETGDVALEVDFPVVLPDGQLEIDGHPSRHQTIIFHP